MKVKEITLIALFPALLAATAGISIPLGNLSSITLQTIFVFLAALILGSKKAFISIAVYIILGLIGVPVFAGFKGGFVILTTYSGGFIVGFLFSVIFIGKAKNVNFLFNDYLSLFVILSIGNLLIYVSGAAYITFLSNGSFLSIIGGFSVYLIGDIIKILVVIHVYKRIRPHLSYE